MIGTQITSDKDGNPLDNSGNKLSASAYQPPQNVMEVWAKVQTDYGINWRLQHRPFDEFDGYSLLDRARMDQQTFAAFVGAEFVPQHKRWRWKGRKNTARNKLIGILARMLASMLYPFVYAFNEDDEEDKMTARVMKILVENHLEKAGYEFHFLFMVASALVNPAVICQVEYVTAFQRVKQKLADGTYKVTEAVDELLSGLKLNIIPVDQFLISDYYSGTGNVQVLPNIIKVRRIPYDQARAEFAKKFYEKGGDKDGGDKDLFDYVEAGKTRVLLAGQERQTLFDIEWTEADRNYVQVITAYYRSEDLELDFVGGVGMFNYEDVYNSNQFKHRRMSLIGEEWMTIPVYEFAVSGFEPNDPTGRFFYYKSGAAKEYWDDASLNKAFQMMADGTALDVYKIQFISGISKVDGTVMYPGAVIGMPNGAEVTSYNLSPNIAAALQLLTQNKSDLTDSTTDSTPDKPVPGVSATAANQAAQNARVFLGVFGIMVADLIKKVGELTMDCILQHTTVGEVDATIPESLNMKYKTLVSKGQHRGKDITNKIVFKSNMMGRDMSPADIRKREWELYEQAGGKNTDQRIYEVNPYKFARTKFSMYIDPDQITNRAMGADKQQKALAFAMLTDPRVLPYTDPEAVANDFVIEEYTDGDPDKYKRKGPPQNLLGSVMGGAPGGGQPNGTGQGASVVSPIQQQPQQVNQ